MKGHMTYLTGETSLSRNLELAAAQLQAPSHQMAFHDAKNKFKKYENLISCRLATKSG